MTSHAHFRTARSMPVDFLGRSPFRQFCHPSHTATNPDTHSSVNILARGEDALLARLHLIRSAQCSIDIQTFIWRNDDVGRLLLRELISAIERGVQVRLLIDHWVTGVETTQCAGLEAFVAASYEGFSVRYFKPMSYTLTPSKLRLLLSVLANFRRFNRRMHNKLFIVDEVAGITGGRNYQNDYFDLNMGRNFLDCDALVIGPPVKEMSKSFERYWQHDDTVDATAFVDIVSSIEQGRAAAHLTELDKKENKLIEKLKRQADDAAFIQSTFIDTAFRHVKASFIWDEPRNTLALTDSKRSTRVALRRMLSKAQQRIYLQSPYMIFDRKGLRLLRRIRRRHPSIDIRLSTNSLASTDNIYAFALAHQDKRDLLKKCKIRLFELLPKPKDIVQLLPMYNDLCKQTSEEPLRQVDRKDRSMPYTASGVHLCIHAKVFIVDDEQSWIGSFNLDPRSAHINFEVALLIHDRAVTEALSSLFLRDTAPGNSWAVAPEKEPALRSYFAKIIGPVVRIFSWIPFWPYRFASNFELNEGEQAVSWLHPEFYNRYRDVGPYPQIDHSLRDIELELASVIGGVLRPLI